MKQLVVLFLKPFVAVITCRDIQHSPDAVAPGLCWAGRGGWDVVDAGGVPVCRARQCVNSCHRYIHSNSIYIVTVYIGTLRINNISFITYSMQ